VQLEWEHKQSTTNGVRRTREQPISSKHLQDSSWKRSDARMRKKKLTYLNRSSVDGGNKGGSEDEKAQQVLGNLARAPAQGFRART